MLKQLNLLAFPTAISIASFDATFFVCASIFGFTAREIILGVTAAVTGGVTVLGTSLWQSARKVGTQVAN